MLFKFFDSAAYFAARLVRPVLNRVAHRQATDIPLERQRRALASTVEFVETHMSGTRAFASKYDLLQAAFKAAKLIPESLILEFGVFQGDTINRIAALTDQLVYGFDSFEGLPESWNDVGIGKGHFAVANLPEVEPNVRLVKGWFNETLPGFLAAHPGPIVFLHVDCDLYSSTTTVFDLAADRLRSGTVIVFDEFFNYPGWEQGEFKALRELLAKTGLRVKFLGYSAKSEQAAVVLTNDPTGVAL